MTQHQKVIEHIEKYGHINVLQAMALYGITQLGRVIHDLKETDKAMCSVPCPELGKGFVRYVPDFEKRCDNLIHRNITALEDPQDAVGVRMNVAQRIYMDCKRVFADQMLHLTKLRNGSYPKSPNVTLEVEQDVA